MEVKTISYRTAFDLERKRIGNIGNNFVSIYECNDIKEIARISNLRDPSRLCFSPDGTQIAIKNTSGKIKVFDIASQQCISNQVSRKVEEGDLMFYIDPDRIFSCFSSSGGGKLYLYNIKSGETTICHKFKNIIAPNLILIKSGFLAFGSYYKERKEYCDDFTEFYKVTVEDTVKVELLLKEDFVHANSEYTCYNNKVFFYSDRTTQIYCYDIENVSTQPLYKLSDREIRTGRAFFYDISISPDGKKIALAFDTHVRVYTTKSYELILLHRSEFICNVSFLNNESLWIGRWKSVEVIHV